MDDEYTRCYKGDNKEYGITHNVEILMNYGYLSSKYTVLYELYKDKWIKIR